MDTRSLPELAWLTLSTEIQPIVSIRRTTRATSPNTNCPAGGSVSVSLAVPQWATWSFGEGMFVEQAAIEILPADTSGSLQVTAARLFVQDGLTGAQVDFGIPVATSLAPQGAQLLAAAQNWFLLASDFQKLTALPGGPYPPPYNAQIGGLVWVKNNDGVNPHIFQILTRSVAYRIQGLQQ